MVLAANDNQPALGGASILRIAPGGDWKIVSNLRPGDKVRTALNGRVEDGRLLQGSGNDLLTVIEVAWTAAHDRSTISKSRTCTRMR